MKDLGCALKGARAKGLVDLVILTKSFKLFGLISRFTLLGIVLLHSLLCDGRFPTWILSSFDGWNATSTIFWQKLTFDQSFPFPYQYTIMSFSILIYFVEFDDMEDFHQNKFSFIISIFWCLASYSHGAGNGDPPTNNHHEIQVIRVRVQGFQQGGGGGAPTSYLKSPM